MKLDEVGADGDRLVRALQHLRQQTACLGQAEHAIHEPSLPNRRPDVHPGRPPGPAHSEGWLATDGITAGARSYRAWWRRAKIAAWTRSCRPSLARMLRTWVLTVCSPIARSRAICRLL